LEAGNERVKVVDGVVRGQIRTCGIGDTGDNSRHLFLDDAVIGSDGLLVVLKRDSEELMLELERLRESGDVGGWSGRRVDGDGGSDRGSGGSVVVSVWNGIHLH
jgi:hypothetical protein